MKNAVNWFQIPVSDFERAVKFYSTILSTEFTKTEAMGAQVAVFPHEMGQGVGGALYKGMHLEPSGKGSVVVLNAGDDLTPVLSKVENAGGKIIMPKTDLGQNRGFMARIMDSEGNIVGLSSRN